MSKSPQHHIYCICGAALHAFSKPSDAATFMVDLFLGTHRGPGHALTNSAGASRGRRRQEKIDDRARRLLESVR